MTNDEQAFYTAGEVARLFRVDPRTVGRWANEGKIAHIRTLGGHRRYLATSVHQALGRFTREQEL